MNRRRKNDDLKMDRQSGIFKDEYLKKKILFWKCFSNEKIVKIKRWNFNVLEKMLKNKKKIVDVGTHVAVYMGVKENMVTKKD